MSQSDYILHKRNNVVYQLQNQLKMPSVLNSSDYTSYASYSQVMFLENNDVFPKYINQLPLSNNHQVFDLQLNANQQCRLDCTSIQLSNLVEINDAQTPNPLKTYQKQPQSHRWVTTDGRFLDSFTTKDQKKQKQSNFFHSSQLFSPKRYVKNANCEIDCNSKPN